jgi:glycosyltransferase involved in cell wall biosynthesis
VNTAKKVLQISPYEPPASGWTKRIKLLRRVIEENGGVCEILDIGPSRKLERPGCINVQSGGDYLKKLFRFSRQGFTFHCHINAEYFRGLLLALAACVIARLFGNRVLTTFHGGVKQRDLEGWRRVFVGPFFWLIFSLSDNIICNSASEKRVLSKFQRSSKIFAIPAFSKQYLEYEKSELSPDVALFIRNQAPVISVYLCFREGFFTDIVIEAISQLVRDWPRLGLVIVGTGDDIELFREQAVKANIQTNICLAGDMGHSPFMTLISKSAIHLRTPITDGVSATVLEALSLRVPVVASANDNRPASVITYAADDAKDLLRVLDSTLRNLPLIVESLTPPVIEDTADTEVRLIFGDTATVGARF